MALALVSSILEQLSAFTTANARQGLKLVTDVEKEVEKLDSNFKAIRNMLEDAEQRQIVEKSVKGWLDKLKEVCYDMEDVLDEWSTAQAKLQPDLELDVSASIPQRMKTSITSFGSLFFQVFRRYDIARKIKGINERLDEIAKEKDRYHLTKIETKQFRRVESTSFIDVSKLHGRDEIKKEIVEKLLNGTSEEGCIQIISLVGMGGIGKTALAQLIFHDHQVRAHFNNVIWVCVSDHFDLNKIARAILGSLDLGSATNLQNPIPLQVVLTKIGDKVRSAKFFLVLDDVWPDRDEVWEPLKATFQQGTSGSRILVTTRKESVAMGMGSSQVFRLKGLSDEVCWLILSQWAFMGKGNELRGKSEDIGRKIAKKCKGLPLAAKTLGGLLREKKSEDEWQHILNSEIWKLNVAEEYIFTPLLLSYYDLPSQIRPCLLYCAIFPKDFAFRPTKLIEHWMAHGYLSSNENSGMEEEEKGGEYFNYLASRSFFQDFDKGVDGNISGCKMHDMVHDFVQYLTKEEIVVVEVNSGEYLRMDASSKKTHHLRVKIAKGDQFPVSIKGIEKLRSLVVDGRWCDVTGEALQAFFKGAKCLRLLGFQMDRDWSSDGKVREIPSEIEKLIHLRYLSLYCSGIQELPEGVCELHNLQYLNLAYCCCLGKLPDGMGKLIHLRHLDLRWTSVLKELPEGVCELHNLQYLNLAYCQCLEKLPDGMGKLINLRYFYSDFCTGLQYYPKGIGRLTSLRKLIPIRARVDGKDAAKEFSVGDLENLDLLGGSLGIYLVGNVVDVEEVRRAKLHNKIHVDQLFLDFKRSGEINRNDIVQALNLPPSFDISVGEGVIRAKRRST